MMTSQFNQNLNHLPAWLIRTLITAHDTKLPDAVKLLSEINDDNGETSTVPNKNMAMIDTENLIGRTYLSAPADDGTQRRLTIIDKINEIDQDRIQSQ